MKLSKEWTLYTLSALTNLFFQTLTILNTWYPSGMCIKMSCHFLQKKYTFPCDQIYKGIFMSKRSWVKHGKHLGGLDAYLSLKLMLCKNRILESPFLVFTMFVRKEEEKNKPQHKAVLKETNTVNPSSAQAECNFVAFILDILSIKLVVLDLVKNKSSYNIFISLDIPENIVCLRPQLICKAESHSCSSIKMWRTSFIMVMLVT